MTENNSPLERLLKWCAVEVESLRLSSTIPSTGEIDDVATRQEIEQVEADIDAVRRHLAAPPTVSEALDNPAVRSACKMLRERFYEAKCDCPAVAACVRCNVIFLVNELDRALAQKNSAENKHSYAVPEAWINKPDSIPPEIIEVCRKAIRREFGDNGTDGYYKRILAKVFRALSQHSEERYAEERAALMCLRFIAYKIGAEGYDEPGATLDSLKEAIISKAQHSGPGRVRRIAEEMRKAADNFHACGNEACGAALRGWAQAIDGAAAPAPDADEREEG